MPKTITEIVEFTAQDGRTENEIIALTEKMAGFFMNECDGCLDCELVKDEVNNKWMNILHWESKELLEKAGKKLQDSFVPKLFSENLILDSIKLSFLEQHKVISN